MKSQYLIRRLALPLVAGIVVTGCGLTRASSLARDPASWASMSCESCDRSRVAVEVRHSVDAKGEQGRYAYARVTNLNPHAVALTVAFTPDEAPVQDSYVPSEYRTLTLGQAGHDSATSVLMLRNSTVRTVFVERVEKF